MANDSLNSLKSFSKLNYEERLKELQSLGVLSSEDIRYLKSAVVSEKLSERVELTQTLIENSLGYFPLPLGIAVNFIINKKPYFLPMAVEETSIIASASKSAKWICKQGEIKTQILGSLSTGQIQFPRVKKLSHLQACIKDHFSHWRDLIHEKVIPSMFQRGGGLKDWELRHLKRPDGEDMAVLHLYIDTCSAMGANIINQICEYLKPLLEKKTGEKAGLCIVSNLADRRMARAEVIVRNQPPDLIEKVEEASLFAEIDPYRACTSNKGVLNGVDSLLIATGNDWRAVEAGLHAYAARGKGYSSLTKWRVQGKDLHGEMEGPFMLGTLGGMTGLHPTAQLGLKILGFPKAGELAGLCCALGLVQNLGALRALVTEGIIEGHMKLHIKNMALKAGASTKEEKSFLEEHLVHILKETKRASLSQAIKTLNSWRRESEKGKRK